MAVQVLLPKLTYEMQEGHILEWLCEEGEACEVGQPLLVVETDKAAVEVPAEQAGTLLRILVHAGETIPVSAAVAWIGAPGEAIPEPAKPAPKTSSSPPVPGEAPTSSEHATEKSPDPPPVARRRGVAASPIAKRLARQLGVDLVDVQQQVGQKRIREADVRAYADELKASQAVPPAEAGEPESELVELTPLQRTMATHLSQAAAIPQSAAACEVDLINLKQMRSGMLAGWEASHGFRLSYTHVLAALVARALRACPKLNASWTEEGIRLYRSVNLGVAMASQRGLVVPVVRNAHRLPLPEIAAEIVRLQRATESNRLLPADLNGGTFTLTNVGMLGISLSIPLLNPPQSAILGIGAERSQVVMKDNKLWTIPVAWITVVSDHRVVDGAAAGEFLQELKALIENPQSALDS
jgi:pyruvate/2-oxoglutarate dehydrogenase complex dihydrolipoamide acyltransferase (E2) component